MDYNQEHLEKRADNIKFIEEDLVSIINFLDRNSQAEIEILIPFDTTAEFCSEEFDLFLQSSRIPVQTLTIGRIEVNPKGKGLGTALIKEIIKYAKKVGFERIVLESILTEEGIRLAEKNKFNKVFVHDEMKKLFPSGPDSYELLLF